MSRFYRMGVVVSGVEPDEAPKIYDALMHEWSFDENDYFYYENDKSIDMCGESNLCGGEDEEEFAQRIAEAVWKAVNRYVEVAVHATYLEDLPYETYCKDEEDYERWMNDQQEDDDDDGDEEQPWCQQALEESFEAVRNANQVVSIEEHPANTDEPGLTPEQTADLRAIQRQALEEWGTPADEIERLLSLDDPATALANLSLPGGESILHVVDTVLSLRASEPPSGELECKIKKYRKKPKPKRKLTIPEVNDEKAQYTWGKENDPWDSSEEEGEESKTT